MNNMETEKKITESRYRRYNDKLALALKLKGYKHISDFAFEVGFDRSFISQIIHGHTKPTIDQASKISNKLAVSIWDVFLQEDIRDLPILKKQEENTK